VELDGVPALSAQLPDELARRAEARALLGDIHRLPDRQRSVLVMAAIDGLSHEEVAGRLDTTVETTRSLLARARENLRRTAAARETACTAVCAALDEAALAGVRSSEIARRHLWSCSDCRAYQRDLRATTPSRLRRLAGWSPWGGVAVAVPELATHARHAPPEYASVQPELVIQEAAKDLRRTARARPAPASTGAPAGSSASSAPVRPAVAAAPKTAAKKAKRAKKRPSLAHASSLSRSEMLKL